MILTAAGSEARGMVLRREGSKALLSIFSGMWLKEKNKRKNKVLPSPLLLQYVREEKSVLWFSHCKKKSRLRTDN